jgi:3-mercaptopyruvate sulfurtransferase SseA
MLKERGVKNVRALRGGWNDWVNAGNPIVKGTK